MAEEDTTLAKTTCELLLLLENPWRRLNCILNSMKIRSTYGHLVGLYLTTVHSVSVENHALTCLSILMSHIV